MSVGYPVGGVQEYGMLGLLPRATQRLYKQSENSLRIACSKGGLTLDKRRTQKFPSRGEGFQFGGVSIPSLLMMWSHRQYQTGIFSSYLYREASLSVRSHSPRRAGERLGHCLRGSNPDKLNLGGC